MCVRECVRKKERERVRVCPRHAEMSKLSLSSCRETQTKAASQPLLLLITSHWRAPCEERRQWSRSNSHTHLSTPHRRHQPLLLCKQRSLRSARQKLHHVLETEKKPTHILQISLCVPRSYILMDCALKGVWIFRRFVGHVKAISCGPGPIKSPDVAFDGPSAGVMAVENCSRFLTHTRARCRLDAKELLSRQTVNKRHFNKTKSKHHMYCGPANTDIAFA